MLLGNLKLWLVFCLSTLLINPAYVSAQSEAAHISDFRLVAMSELDSRQNCHDAELDDSNWQRFEFPNLTAKQHVCIRASLFINENGYYVESPGLLFLALASYHVYFNEELLGTNGHPSTSVSGEEVGAISSLLSFYPASLVPGKHLISIELSSFNLPPVYAAIAYDLMLVDQQQIYDALIVTSAITAMLIGVLLIMFVIFLTLFFRFQKSSSFIIFSMLCLTTAFLLGAEQWKIFVNYQYDMHLFRLQLIISITLLVNGLLLAYYLEHHSVTRKLNWLIGWVLAQLVAVITAQSYDERSIFIFAVTMIFLILLGLSSIQKNKSDSRIGLVITGFSLALLLLTPRLFIELGFALSIVLVLISIGISLLNQLSSQRDLALQSAKLKGELLRRNLQPHYLMNSLMQVQELIDVSPKQANVFVEQLASEFRALVAMSDKALVPIDQELALCRSHLHIMSVRYQKQYQLQVTYLDETKPSSDIYLPAAIIHSQIENCFSHNRITSDQSIELRVSKDKNEVRLELITPVDVNSEYKGLGIGEAYIRAKMTQSCLPGWQLQSEARELGWVTIYQFVPENRLIEKDIKVE